MKLSAIIFLHRILKSLIDKIPYNVIGPFLIAVFLIKNSINIFRNLFFSVINRFFVRKDLVLLFRLMFFLNHESFKSFILGMYEDSLVQKKSVFPREIDLNDPIVVIPVKDDLEKIIFQSNQLRNKGFKYFVYIDNGSTDGTLEYILTLPNVEVYSVYANYIAARRNGWVQQIIEKYGYDRWYLFSDSDEIFCFPQEDFLQVDSLIDFLNLEAIKRVDSIMLDLHSNQKDTIWTNDLGKMVFFDTNLYFKNTFRGTGVKGGFRERVFFDSKYNSGPQLRKTSLVKPDKNFLYASHFPLPYNRNFGFMPVAILKHYKFLTNDKKKYSSRKEDGNFSNNSFEYYKYMKDDVFESYSNSSAKLETTSNIVNLTLFNNAIVKKWIKFSDSKIQ